MNNSHTLRTGLLGICVTLLLSTSCVTDETQDSETHQHTNALIHSTSPYLLQHAHNPVNWMPWGPAAFAKAQAENKPIFVSIGYSTCYWCHVMERESFENEEVAKVLNENYIAIKVDREERPDIDEQLMLATQLMTRRGGWPNSVWLTTDGRPWMAGTYFPRAQFLDALRQLSSAWKTQAEAVEKQADALSAAVRKASALDVPKKQVTLDSSPMTGALTEMKQIFDRVHGGFGSQPKFPPHGLLRLLALAAADGNEDARTMLTSTLNAIWCGGIHDHVGGGFHRYSTDERWFLPHFEKMLYDNGQLMRAYSEAYALTPNPIYQAAVEDIFNWLHQEMTHRQGAFYSALDSESEGGEEGRYYTWSIDELHQVLADADAEFFASTYNFQAAGNFTEEATGKRVGTNIPFLRLGQIDLSLSDRCAALREQLNIARQTREYPHLDDKILTSWNGLMISALARAGVVFDDQRFTRAAERAANFILDELQVDGQLLRSWRGGQASLPAYLDDYAYFAEALIELHAATGESHWLEEAQRLTDRMLELFEDPLHGGFYFTSREHEELLVRSKHVMGGGNLPTANGVAAQVLLKLHATTQQPRYRMSAQRTLESFWNVMLSSPQQIEHLVLANSMFLQQQQSAESPASSEASPTANQYQAPNGEVAINLISEYTQVVPGQVFKLAIDLDIAAGFHLYGPTPGKSLVQATSVDIANSSSFSPGKITVPEGKLQNDPVLKQELRIYDSHVRFTVPITIASTAQPGSAEVIVTVDYQACDDTQCLAPATATLKLALNISADRSIPSNQWSESPVSP